MCGLTNSCVIPGSKCFIGIHSVNLYNNLCVCACVCVLRHFGLFVTPWTVACQVPLSKEFSRQEYWSWSPSPTPRNLPDLGIKCKSLCVSYLGRWILYHCTTWEAYNNFMREVLLTYSFYRQENWGTERLCYFCKVTELISDEAETQTLRVSAPKFMLLETRLHKREF